MIPVLLAALLQNAPDEFAMMKSTPPTPPISSIPVSTVQEIPDLSNLPLLNPDLRERKTAKIRLMNGVEALLISDPGADQSSAAVCVDAGSWNDPAEYPGMAHFCEHMLFMGSKKYPEPNTFMNRVSDLGGLTNAYTASNRTVYMFSCAHDGFLETLDCFSRFFIDPLFSPSEIARELHAVDQEYAKNLENDRWREYMVFKELNNPEHPNRKFSTGNSATLSGIPQEALKSWHQEHYGAGKLHLFIYSNLPLDTLKSMASDLFSSVPEQTAKDDSEPLGVPVTSERQRGKITSIKPIQNRQTLSLSWELPPELSRDNTESAELIAYALDRGQEYSLYEKLKREQLVDNVTIAVDDIGGKDHRFFYVILELTQQGIEEIQRCVHRCFEAIAGLRASGVPLYLFQEKNAIAQLKYQYQDREDAFHMAEMIGGSISDEPLSTFPRGQILASSYSPEKVQQTLRLLQPDSCCIALVAPPHLSGIAPDQKEKWFQAEYAVRPIPREWRDLWQNSAPNPDIRLAQLNPFLPSRFDLVALEEASQPVLLSETDGGTAFYSRLSEFSAPDASIHLHLRTPEIQPTAKNSVLVSLYLDHLTDLISPALSAAKSAGLSSRFDLEKLRLHIQVAGFSDKSTLLLEEILSKMAFHPPTKEEFNIYKDRHQKLYENMGKNLALAQAKDLMDSLLMSERTSGSEKLDALQSITYENFLQFYQKFLEKTHTQAFYAGNLTKQEAQSSWIDVQHILSRGTYQKSQHSRPKVLELPQRGPFALHRNTGVQGNAAILAVDFGKLSLDRKAAHDILSTTLREAFFQELRSKQKTGYIAKADPLEIEDRLFHLFMVQSNSHQPEDLVYRFELFFEEYLQTLDTQIDAARFDQVKATCIHSLKTRFRNLTDKASLLNYLAYDKKRDFRYVDKRIHALEKLTHAQFLEFVREFLTRENLKRLAIFYEGRLNAPFAYETIDKTHLLDLSRYAASSTREDEADRLDAEELVEVK